MSYKLVVDVGGQIAEFVAKGTGSAGWGPCSAFGVEKDGKLVQGIVFEQYTGSNVMIHIYGVPGEKWRNRAFWWLCSAYPFTQLGCDRITAFISESNSQAMRLAEHYGMERECVMEGAMYGANINVMVLWKNKSRWLNLKGVEKWL